MASTNRSNGEGSIYRRHIVSCPPAEKVVGDDGKARYRRPKHNCKGPYVASLTTGWRGDAPIRKKVSGPSRASVATKLRELRDKVKAGQLPHGRVPTVEEWLTYWLEQIVPVKARSGTQRTYGTHVRKYLIPLLGHHRLDKLTPEHIADAWDTLHTLGCPGKEDAQPIAWSTIHRSHAILSRSLKVAGQRSLLMRNPAALMDAPLRDDKEAAVLTREQAEAIREVAKASRNGARWTVALSFGLRQGEALGLRWADVDLDKGQLTVRRSLSRVKGKGLVLGPVKSRTGERAVKLHDKLTTELKAHRKAQNAERLAAGSRWQDDDYVFAHIDGRPIDPKDDWTNWRDLLAEAGLEHVKLHSARHTAATMLIAMGVPVEVVKEILGHSNITITQVYTHRVNDLHLDAAKKMDEFWG